MSQPGPDYLARLARHAGLEAAGIEPPRAQVIELRGLRLRYLEWGQPHAPALVLLHGGGQSAHTWDAFCLAAARRFRCLALDQRGHGDSQWSQAGDYAMADHAGDIAAFVQALGLGAPVVMGMSMGGVNAIAYAAAHPLGLRGLVCVDIGPHAQHEPVDRLLQGLDGYRWFDSPEDAARQLSRLGARREPALLRDTLSLNLRRLDDGRWTWKYDPRTLVGLSAQAIMDARRPLWGVLDRITCPVLVLRGADSEIFSPDDAARFAGALADARWREVPRARHSIQTDNPAGLAQALFEFTDALPPVGRA